MTAKIFFLLSLIPVLWAGALMIVKDQYVGEPSGSVITFGSLDIFLILLLYLILYALIWLIYKGIFCKKTVTLSFFPTIHFNVTKVHFVFFAVLCFQLFALLYEGAGKDIVNPASPVSHSILYNISNIFHTDSFILIYYLFCRDGKKIYRLNILLYLIFRVMCGWTGDILTIAILELFCQEREKGYIYNIIRRIGIYKSMVIFFLGGALLYTIFYPLKFSIRYGVDYADLMGLIFSSSYSLDYWDAAEKLISRLSFFPTAVLGFQNADLIADLYQSTGIFLSETLSFFRPLIPSFIFDYKDSIYPIPALLASSEYSIYIPDMNSSTNAGFIAYNYILFQCDPIDYFCSLILSIVLAALFIGLLGSMIKGNNKCVNDVSILYLSWMLGILKSGSNEMLYAYKYLGILYMLVVLYFTGALVLRRKNKTYNGVI